MTFHGLRHTCAAEWYTKLLGEGKSEYEARLQVSKWLGHGDIGTTANIYTRLQYKTKIGMAEQISKKFSAAMDSKSSD